MSEKVQRYTDVCLLVVARVDREGRSGCFQAVTPFAAVSEVEGLAQEVTREEARTGVVIVEHVDDAVLRYYRPCQVDLEEMEDSKALVCHVPGTPRPQALSLYLDDALLGHVKPTAELTVPYDLTLTRTETPGGKMFGLEWKSEMPKGSCFYGVRLVLGTRALIVSQRLPYRNQWFSWPGEDLPEEVTVELTAHNGFELVQVTTTLPVPRHKEPLACLVEV